MAKLKLAVDPEKLVGVLKGEAMIWNDGCLELKTINACNERKNDIKRCENCECYEEEWEYCFRNGHHAPKDGHCKYYREHITNSTNKE